MFGRYVMPREITLSRDIVCLQKEAGRNYLTNSGRDFKAGSTITIGEIEILEWSRNLRRVAPVTSEGGGAFYVLMDDIKLAKEYTRT